MGSGIIVNTTTVPHVMDKALKENIITLFGKQQQLSQFFFLQTQNVKVHIQIFESCRNL